MFSKAKSSKPDDAGAAPDAVANAAVAAPAPKRSNNAKGPSVPSIISADVIVSGNVDASGEVQLDGELHGDIKSQRLIVGEKACVKGEICCENVTVRGRVEGSVRAKQVTLAATAHVEGDIIHSSLSVESGAFFEGNARHSDDPIGERGKSDGRKPRPAPSPRPVDTSADETALRPTGTDGPSFSGGQNRSPLR
ncbi:MAG: polymer-forming cytoskeletal protein [Parvularculaceae bacterium]